MQIHLYRNSTEAIHRKQGRSVDLYAGLPDDYDSYAKWFVVLLRLLEMQDVHLTKSPATREDIAHSIRAFLQAFVKDHPQDSAATELGTISVKTMTEL